MELSQAIKTRMTELNLSDLALSKKCGVDRRIIANIKNNENATWLNILQVCNYLEILPDFICVQNEIKAYEKKQKDTMQEIEDVFENLGKVFKPENLTKSDPIELELIQNIEFDNIELKDAPDFANAFIVSAEYKGRKLTEKELNEINENSDFVHNKVIDYIY